ncbi:MAG: redoxin domain-containing protein [Gemmataceae bacterium]|nr:redoxin domain-containing protein [Gemmataceae bacterium]
MTRLLTIALLAFVSLAAVFTQAGGDKDFQVKGTFTKDDPRDQTRGGPSQVHTVKLKAGKAYTIDMVSAELNSYLRLLDPKGNQLEENDNSGGGLNARIFFNCFIDGDYKIACTTFAGNMTGSYALTVKNTGAAKPPPTAHALMIDKDAPALQADFAVNGKPVTLADLKGKVVLVNFWEMRSSSSVKLLAKLAEWNKAHKADGLVIVGVTFYHSEIGQKPGFDKETGDVVTVAKADKTSDQALLREFAAHHKIEHLLLALPKAEALRAFDAYVVNGFPQVVLIDRKGVVRLIDVAGEKNSAQIESEIKKVLAEK